MPGRDSSKDKNEGATDGAKETAGSLSGNEDRKAEGRGDQDKGILKKK